jgi:hypothetical protein
MKPGSYPVFIHSLVFPGPSREFAFWSKPDTGSLVMIPSENVHSIKKWEKKNGLEQSLGFVNFFVPQDWPYPPLMQGFYPGFFPFGLEHD